MSPPTRPLLRPVVGPQSPAWMLASPRLHLLPLTHGHPVALSQVSPVGGWDITVSSP